MKLLTQDQLRPGIPTWYTAPESLGHGRVVVCDLLLPTGKIYRNAEVVGSIAAFKAMPFMLRKYLLLSINKRFNNGFLNL